MRYIRDEEFIRGNCPMTKEDIRILSISKMNLEENSKVLDVGAGTGSVSIQAATVCKKGRVLAIEKDEEALDIIKKNKEKFNCENLKIIKGEALEVEESIKESFNSIFIGGSGGSLEEIISRYGNKLLDQGTMILNFITINNLNTALEALKKLNYKTECIQVAISKAKEKSNMLIANNPIFIITAIKNGGNLQ
ncbi:precorrin-6Y C5,15-methyltransferase (decarboxylating) subunit CbiT [Clostridium botulinum]|uniref:Precorrin-6Y C5,15-methyltransferase (Decarboxylating), CbiT subunit n=1 Tax=Clostridium botulinum (strain Langeland / NCTC 10281 / Type F) TaxID=441772 RepID=A7GBY2_CLOBL|nr:precorrin-6Y C5,15-methyltransferase (decarboxylating) subunit CbiT [Clostridium botulinum]ABS39610.1 precorrin-6Y C5,15-methyltransferase (decarboxylating), CbiT subunit [Clostridium botulinum F str. Langeland]ADF98761.1 precorrin-6Y C5,15-methyltransferase (decarboxylating), CbiT subunit [Clostridium botulinum F str. 230613]KKM39963.1 SAM-dependent methlyltransferase [Clostridium botulinum]MBY6792025.1 precorrin-6Y C5,15-methyltransferase (decarboxylating) subunit CbiT [Clostridium botulin